VGLYEKRAQRAAARAIDAMPHPRWAIGAQKLETIESIIPPGCPRTRSNQT